MGTVKINNPNLAKEKKDALHHLGFSVADDNLPELFGDVKFILMGGSACRMLTYANYLMKELDIKIPFGTQLLDLAAHAHRYSMYKIGPIITVNHGMGGPSLSILLNEMIKLAYYAKLQDPIFMRLGTCGGLGVDPGTICITKTAVDGMMQDWYELPVLLKMTKTPCVLDEELANDLKDVADELKIDNIMGKTLSTLDFYEGQGRLDGANCEYEEADKRVFLQKIRCGGCVNIEMEAVPFSAMTNRAGIKSAIVCVALVNRLQGDLITGTSEELNDWEDRPIKIAAQYIKNALAGKYTNRRRGAGCTCKG